MPLAYLSPVLFDVVASLLDICLSLPSTACFATVEGIGLGNFFYEVSAGVSGRHSELKTKYAMTT